MTPPKPPVELDLAWQKDLLFTGMSGGNSMTADSAGVAGPTPMQSLGFALAACMAMDLVHILQKGRQPLTGLRARLSGVRADAEPRRFTTIALHYTITGDVPEAVIQRAIDLSREKYCSVWHSMRHDIDLTVTYSVAGQQSGETQNSER